MGFQGRISANFNVLTFLIWYVRVSRFMAFEPFRTRRGPN